MPSADYWKKRFEAVEKMNHSRSEKMVSSIIPAFNSAESKIQVQIDAWYQRFADNNSVSIVEAKKMLNAKELSELKWDVDEYIKAGRQNAIDQSFMKELENASARVHISRLEALKMRTQMEVEKAYGNYSDRMDQHMADTYTQDYYHTAFELQKGVGVGFDIGRIDQKRLDRVIRKPWTTDDTTFSDRIWKSKQQLIDTLHTEMTQMCILGDPPDKLIKQIESAFNVSKKQAGRLVMTESAHMSSEAHADCYKDLDVEECEVVATLDSITSEICRQMDGTVFKLSEREEGVNCPPFHPWCRSTYVPYFEDNNDGERIARGADGKTYKVPADMKYQDWEDHFVTGKKDPAEWGQKTDDLAERRKQRVDERRKKVSETISNTSNLPNFDEMSHDDIKKWADENLKTRIENTKGVNSDFYDETVKALAVFENRMGGKTIDGLSVKFGGLPNGIDAKYDDSTKTLLLKKTGNLKVFEERQEKANIAYRTKWGRDRDYYASTTYRGTVLHELGHAVDIESGQALSKALSRTTALDEASVKISAYAGTSQGVRVTKRSEAWAENFSAYLEGGKNASKVPQEIKDMIDGWFEVQKNSNQGMKEDVMLITDILLRNRPSIPLNNLTSPHKKDIMKMIDDAPDIFRDLLHNDSDRIMIANSKIIGGAFYSPKYGVFVNLDKDSVKPIGKWSTLFHEIGHAVDTIHGSVSNDILFENALRNDFNSLIENYKKTYGVTTKHAYKLISKSLRYVDDYGKATISDIFGALTNNECVGEYLHNTSYWKENSDRLTMEAFANFFSCSVQNNGSSDILKQVFPTAYKEFIDIIMGL